MPLVFAFQIVDLRCISLTHSSQAGARCQPRAWCQGQAKITAAGARTSYVKVTGGFVTGRGPDALPWVPPLAAVTHAESSSWLRAVITDASGTPAPVEGLGGGAFNFGRRRERLAGWTRDPFQPVAHNPASSLHSFSTATPNSHHPCSPQAGKMPPPSLGTCTLEQNKEGKLKITKRSQLSSLVGFPHVQPPQQPARVSASVWV